MRVALVMGTSAGGTGRHVHDLASGLVGAGRSEILETVYGARRASGGTVRVHGRLVRPGSVPAAVDLGVARRP